jgi:hypothetical protein
MVAIAFGNATVREVWYGRSLSELAAHQISSIAAIVLFGIYIWILMGHWRLDGAKQAVTAGVVWLVLTVVFEFVFQRLVAGVSWQRLIHEYNVFAGRLWLVVLLWIAFAPLLCLTVRRRRS